MITVYTRRGCGACVATKSWLKHNGIDYIQIDIDTDTTARAFVDQMGYTSLPVMRVGDEHWSGFRIDRLTALKVLHPGNNTGVIGS